MITLKDKILSGVMKPTRYTGGELNAVIKNADEVDIRFGFCFPDVYEIAMSHLGLKIIYHALNTRPDTWCERVFAPWVDMEEKMREHGMRLFALESGDEVTHFDILGFTLQYELSYSNIVNMLDLAEIPLLAAERSEEYPIIYGGGPCAYNAEPIADIFDFFMLGEGEQQVHDTMEVLKAWKLGGKKSKKELLEKLVSEVEGIYVPSFYDVEYNEDGTVKSITPNNPHAPKTVKKTIVKDFDKTPAPDKIIVPYGEVVHDRVMLELMRGCLRGCRFCQAGYIYRPLRERKPETLLSLANSLLTSSGYDEISLSSLSTSDFSGLPELTDGLIKMTEEKKIGLSLPSLRIDNFSLELMEKVQKVRKSGITFACEAGTQRLRDVINKNVTEDNVLKSTNLLFRGGWSNVKLYFMIGLPTETDEDLLGIPGIGKSILDVYFAIPKEERTKQVNITMSASCFVPKPFTAFQWFPMNSREELRRKQQFIKENIPSKRLRFTYHDDKTSYLEGVFARGDRRLSKAIITAVRRGCKFDAWGEFFDFDKWLEAIRDCGLDPDFYAARERSYDEVLPWDHIDVGVTKEFLIRENERAKAGVTTPNCREKCAGCGAARFGCGVCFEKTR